MSKKDLPNILMIMSDEHGPMFSGTYGHPLVETPNMDRLAEMGTTFENGYCNSPLCTPSRLSMMTGKYVSHCEGWDNATPLYVGRITWPWLLKSVGYETALNGKMHMMGPKRLYGFDKQLTFDPHSDNMLPVYRWKDKMTEAKKPWEDVLEAGPGTSPVTVHDDYVEQAAHSYLKDDDRKKNPWALVCGFISPHFPLKVPEKYFNKYYPNNSDLPDIPPGHLDNLPPSAKRLQKFTGTGGPYTDEQTKKARAAYYGLVSFLDEKIGRIIDTLESTGQLENTIIIHTSDHGEMAGEHGLWRKMCFYEQSARVPIQISWSGGNIPKGRWEKGVTSNVDIVATILDAVGINPVEWNMDGDSLLPYLYGKEKDWKDEAICEHLAHGTDGPMIMVRRGDWKLNYIHRENKEFELYNLKNDPGEFNNLAGQKEFENIQKELFNRIKEIWPDPDDLEQKIRESQEERFLLRELTSPTNIDPDKADFRQEGNREHLSAIDFYAGIVNRGKNAVEKDDPRLF